MERFWKAALSVAGIGAIGLFVLWSLYKQWLTLPIFPQLSQDQTFQLLRYFLFLTFGAAVLGVGAYLITHTRSSTPRLPDGSPFTKAQLDTYRSIWVSLQEVRQAGDALWDHASQGNLDTFVGVLREAKSLGAAGAIFFPKEDYRQMMALLDLFANYQIGKERLIEMRTARGRSLNPSERADLERQIQQNREHLKRYTDLLDKMRITCHERLSNEH